MDGICSAVLNKIYALGTPGRYFIVSTDEFFEGFPEDGKRDMSELKKALKTLTAEGYIDIKYSSGNMFCVALIKEFIPQSPPVEAATEEKIATPGQNINCGRVFFAAALGGAIGSALIIAIAWIVSLC